MLLPPWYLEDRSPNMLVASQQSFTIKKFYGDDDGAGGVGHTLVWVSRGLGRSPLNGVSKHTDPPSAHIGSYLPTLSS